MALTTCQSHACCPHADPCCCCARRSRLLLRGGDRRLTGLEARRRGGLSRWGRRGGVGDRGRLRVSGLTRLRRSGDRALRRSGDLDLCQSRDLQQALVCSVPQSAIWTCIL